MTILPKSRAEALAVGAKKYFTGKPCPKGHTSPRIAHSAACVECQRIHSKEGYRKWYNSLSDEKKGDLVNRIIQNKKKYGSSHQLTYHIRSKDELRDNYVIFALERQYGRKLGVKLNRSNLTNEIIALKRLVIQARRLLKESK